MDLESVHRMLSSRFEWGKQLRRRAHLEIPLVARDTPYPRERSCSFLVMISRVIHNARLNNVPHAPIKAENVSSFRMVAEIMMARSLLSANKSRSVATSAGMTEVSYVYQAMSENCLKGHGHPPPKTTPKLTMSAPSTRSYVGEAPPSSSSPKPPHFRDLA